MKILNAQEMKQADMLTMKEENIPSFELMKRAASACHNWLLTNILTYNYHIFCGPGNNGGDGLLIARLLAGKYTKVKVHVVNDSDNESPTFKEAMIYLNKRPNIEINYIKTVADLPKIELKENVIDAIFGIGLNKPVSGIFKETIEHINKYSKNTIAIDVPSGLFSEKNDYTQQTIIQASYTLTFHPPYLSFFFEENYKYVGEFVSLNIRLLTEKFARDKNIKYNILKRKEIAKIITPRQKFAHKGDFGHGLLIAGSLGKIGAAVMAAGAALKSGIGLLTVHTPKCGTTILQTAVPDAMLTVDQLEDHSSEFYELNKYKAIAIGPGIGLKRPTILMLKVLIEESTTPLIFDADAITIISENKDWLNKIPKNSIFTPHPKELEKLIGHTTDSYERSQKTMEFANKYGCFVILKKANTEIYTPDSECYFNTTGNPAMAKGGNGDVLTGMLLAFLSQGKTPLNTCKLAVYLHGLAGDFAAEKYGQHSVLASELINFIHKAFKIISKE